MLRCGHGSIGVICLKTHSLVLSYSPGATQCFKNCLLAAETGLYQGANKHDLIALNDEEGNLQLELTLGIHILSKVLAPTYTFKLHPVRLSEMDILNARIWDQGQEIANLRSEIQALTSKASTATITPPPQRVSARAFVDSTPVYYRAETTTSTLPTRAIVWQETDYGTGFSNFRVLGSGAIQFLRQGLYSIQIVVRHTNRWDPDDIKEGFKGSPPEREAFQLFKNRQKLVSSFGSSVKGIVQSSPLVHITSMEQGEEVSVLYTGTGTAMERSYIIIYKVN